MKLNAALALLLLATPLARAAETSPVAPPPGSEAQWIDVLKSGASRKDKADACRFLAIVGTRNAVPTLVSLLGNEELSHMALYALQTLPDPSVDAALRNALAQEKGRPLIGVMATLGVRRDSQAVKPIGARLQDADPAVAQAAARALGSIGTLAAAKALREALPKTPPENQVAFQEGLFRCAEALAIAGERKEAADLYDRLLTPGAAHQVRAGAVRGAILTRKDGVKVLQQHLQDPDYVGFAAAARAAMELPGPETTKALTTELPKLTADRQVVVLQTLGRRGEVAALPAVQDLARTGAEPVRIAAIRIVAELGQANAASGLSQLVTDPDAEVAQAAQEALAGLPGREADAAVMALLGGTDPARRITGIELAGRRRMKSAVPALLKCASDTDAAVRGAALKQLAELGTAAEVPALLERLAKSTTPQEVNALEQTLSGVAVRIPEPDQAGAPIAAALATAQPAQKVALIRTLSAVGGAKALKAIEAQLGSPDREVRVAAIRAFSDWKTAEAAPILLAVAQVSAQADEKLLALRGYLGLLSQLELSAADRLSMAKEARELVQRDDEKKLLLSGLGRIPSPEALPLITPHLGNEALRDEAAAALVAVAEKLLAGQDAAAAAALVEPLDQVARAPVNTDLAKKAKALADQARAKK